MPDDQNQSSQEQDFSPIPGIEGGLLDPRTFPAWAGTGLPAIWPQNGPNTSGASQAGDPSYPPLAFEGGDPGALPSGWSNLLAWPDMMGLNPSSSASNGSAPGPGGLDPTSWLLCGSGGLLDPFTFPNGPAMGLPKITLPFDPRSLDTDKANERSYPPLSLGGNFAGPGPNPAPADWYKPFMPPTVADLGPPPWALNAHGYVADLQDRPTLARMIYAEAGPSTVDHTAIGWSIVNRIGDREFGPTLDAVLHKPYAFAIVKEGNKQGVDSPQWDETADPTKLVGKSKVLWDNAWKTAGGILGGAIPDPTGGGTYFFSSKDYDGRPETAPGSFPGMLRSGRIVPGPYNSGLPGRNKNYFFRKR